MYLIFSEIIARTIIAAAMFDKVKALEPGEQSEI